MILELLPNVGSSLTLENDGGATGYSCRIIDLGNAVWDHAFSGPRGTQGALPASGVPQNRPFAFTIRISGEGATAALAKASLASRYSTFQKAAENLRRYGGRISYRSNNQASNQYLRVMVTLLELDEFTPAVEANNRADGTLGAVCAPYVEAEATTEFYDPFVRNTVEAPVTWYSYDAGSGTIGWVSSERLAPTTTAEKALYLTGSYASDVTTTLKLTTGATVPTAGIGLTARRLDGSNYLWGAVDPAAGLALYKKDGGTFTSLPLSLSGALGALAAGTTYWLRLAAAGNLLTLTLYTTDPAEGGTAVRTGTHTLSGANATKFGTGIYGNVGFRTDAVPTDYRYDDFRVDPLSWRVDLPAKVPLGYLVGDAPPLLDASIRTSGGSAAPIWALLAWWGLPTTPLSSSVAPVGLVEAETGTSLSGWAVTADADYQGGSGLQLTTSGAGTGSATFVLDPSTVTRDEYTQGELSIEVWARIEIASSVVSPKLTLSASPNAGASFGQTRYSDEWGSAGKLLTLPSSGTRFRFVRLGTITLHSDPSRAIKWNLNVGGSWAAGSSGTFGLDYLVPVPIRQRVAGATGKANDSAYPKFIASTSDTTKTLRSDGSGLVASGAGTAFPDHGLGGVLELPIGYGEVLVKLSSLVPDDPTSDATSEQLAHTNTVITLSHAPRWAFLRAD